MAGAGDGQRAVRRRLPRLRAVPTDDRVIESPPDGRTRRWLIAAAVLGAVAGLPLVWAGPGNDLDVANVFRAGRSIVRHGGYVPSRAPGSPVHELAVGLLDGFAGPLAATLFSVAAAIVLAVALDRLLAGEGLGPNRRWAIAVLIANPWFLIAATSTVDFVPALAFVTLSALALRRGRPVWAGLAAAASMGSRIGSALLIASLLFAELTDTAPSGGHRSPGTDRGTDRGADRSPSTDRGTGRGADREPSIDRHRGTGRRPWRTVVITGVVAATTTLLLFVPSFIHAGGLTFAENDFRSAGLLVHLGRAAVKDLMLLGPVATLVALLAVPAILTAVGEWRHRWLVRFAVPALLTSQLLFVRFPWKMGHLLPTLFAVVVLLAFVGATKPRLLMALVGLQLLYGIVAVDVIEPDRPNEATGGTVTLTISTGPVLRDWTCRRDHPDPHRGRQRIEVEAAWNCAQPFER